MSIPTKTVGQLTIPVYGAGTWEMGGRQERDSQNDDAVDVAALSAALELGVTHIDTAEMYAAGHTERLVRRAIKDFDRDKLFIASKVTRGHQRPNDLILAFEDTCERLGVEYLDLYMPHSFDATVPLDEVMDAICSLVDDGWLRHVGVSNFSVDRLQRAVQESRHPIAVNQVHYSVTTREVERAKMLEFCQENDVVLNAYAPLDKGALQSAPILDELAAKYDASPAQVALNWLTSQQNVITICKTSSVDHLKENLQAFDWQMEPADIERVREEMPNRTFRSERGPLRY